MNIRASLKGQYFAGFKMLKECIKLCPDSIWTSGTHPRNFWRIAYHALYYSHMYSLQNPSDFKRWSKHREGANELWDVPKIVDPNSKQEILEYLDEIVAGLSDSLNQMDIESPSSGVSWYKDLNRLDIQILTIRHLQGHVGQLSELLMAHGIEIDWVGIS